MAFLLPGTATWIRVSLSMVWLCALIAGAFVLGNRGEDHPGETRELRQRLRDGLLYIGVASLLVTIFSAVAIHDLEKGIHRNIRENWVISVITAGFVLAFSINDFWGVRRSWRMWAVLAAYSFLHFSLCVPALGHLARIPAGYISAIGIPELMLVSFALHLATRVVNPVAPDKLPSHS
jgi:hypothetical protein